MFPRCTLGIPKIYIFADLHYCSPLVVIKAIKVPKNTKKTCRLGLSSRCDAAWRV